MKSIPRRHNKVIPKDGRTVNELGKELGVAHELLCAIRKLGGTRKDIREICNKPEALQALIYRTRGILPEEETVDTIMNLEAEPRIPTGFNSAEEIIFDQRLGMWVMELNHTKGYVLGDKKMAFIHPKNGDCMNNGMFVRLRLGWIDFIDLNAQAATALYENPSFTQNIFSSLSEGVDWKDEKIFFLGTIWKQRALTKGNSGKNHGWDICAMALTSNTEGEVALKEEPLPVGCWPENYYIAILVDL